MYSLGRFPGSQENKYREENEKKNCHVYLYKQLFAPCSIATFSCDGCQQTICKLFVKFHVFSASSLEQLSDLNGSFCPPSVKRVESPCFALKTESDDAPGFNVYENTDNLMSSRRTSLAPTTHDQPPSSTLERPLDSYVVSSSGETGSEKSIASRHSPRLNGNLLVFVFSHVINQC